MKDCSTCGGLADFSQSRSDGEPSTRSARFDALVRLGTWDDWHLLHRCTECGEVFAWLRERDSDTGVTDESVRRLAGQRALEAVAAALAWPWLEDKRELLASFAARAGVLTLETVGDVRAGDPVALVKAELLGPKAAPLVPALLAHLDSELGARALVAAGALAPVEAAARKGVQPALRALARLAPPSAVPVLREVLDGSTGEGRCAAAYGLGRLGAERARLLELLVEQGNTELGKACRDALATMRAVDELLDALSRDDWGLRWAGAVGLGRCGDASARVREALAKSLTHPGGPPISRTAAVTALLQLGEPRASVESLVDAMASYPEPSVREAVPACRETLGAR